MKEKSKPSVLAIAKHFHALLVVMAGTIVAALVLPLLLRFVQIALPEAEFSARFLTDGEGNALATLFHATYALGFFTLAAWALLPCVFLNLPLAFAAYRRGRETPFQH